MAKQNYRCAGCGTRIDPGMTRVITTPSFKFKWTFWFRKVKKMFECRLVFIQTTMKTDVLKK